MPTGSYYKQISQATQDLADWIQDPNRDSWSQFIRRTMTQYGFGQKKMYGILKECYPVLDIEDNKLVRVEPSV